MINVFGVSVFRSFSFVAVLVAVCAFPHRHSRYCTSSWEIFMYTWVLSHVKTCLFRTNNHEFCWDPRTWLEIARLIFFSFLRRVCFYSLLTFKSYSVMVCKPFFISPQSLITSFWIKINKASVAQATFKSIRSLVPLMDRVLVQRFKPETVSFSSFLPRFRWMNEWTWFRKRQREYSSRLLPRRVRSLKRLWSPSDLVHRIKRDVWCLRLSRRAIGFCCLVGEVMQLMLERMCVDFSLFIFVSFSGLEVLIGFFLVGILPFQGFWDFG
jgi:hypothetical protein